MIRRLAWSLVAVTLVGGVAAANHQFSTGPVASRTGAPAIGAKPAEPVCTACHVTYVNAAPVPNLNLPGGGVEILDLPLDYEPGVRYPIRVRVWSDSTEASPNRKWGFQVTAVRASDGEGAGLFEIPFPDTLQFKLGSGSYAGRLYVEHTDNGNRDGLGGPVEWPFSWVAPDPSVGTIRFFAAGNAANGNFSSDGDFIYTTSDSVLDHVTPTVRVTWGDLKRRYR